MDLPIVQKNFLARNQVWESEFRKHDLRILSRYFHMVTFILGPISVSRTFSKCIFLSWYFLDIFIFRFLCDFFSICPTY